MVESYNQPGEITRNMEFLHQLNRMVADLEQASPSELAAGYKHAGHQANNFAIKASERAVWRALLPIIRKVMK